MITENMIDAGEKAYEKTYTLTVHRRHEMVSAIYEAMTVQRQKDELKAYEKEHGPYVPFTKQARRDFYDKHSHLVEGHSSR